MAKSTKAATQDEPLPAGFKVQDGVAWGSREEYLLEIKFHNSKRKNATTGPGQFLISKLINDAQNDEKVKVILIHGGKFFSSGNDLSLLVGMRDKTKEEQRTQGLDGIKNKMDPYLFALDNSVKPVVAVVRGMCIGIQFTMLTLVDFIYCSPDAVFQVPFMKSFQSPEGTSTLNFPL